MSLQVKRYQDEDIIRLLQELKKRDSAYPAGLQGKRRMALLALALSMGASKAAFAKAAGASTVQGAGTAAPLSIGMQVTLVVLSSAIVGLSTFLGVTLYNHRDEIRILWGGGSPTAVLVSPIPSSSKINPLATSTPVSTASAYPTIMITSTPSPIFTTESGLNPPINLSGTPTKPGLHLGQTKTPKPSK